MEICKKHTLAEKELFIAEFVVKNKFDADFVLTALSRIKPTLLEHARLNHIEQFLNLNEKGFVKAKILAESLKNASEVAVNAPTITEPVISEVLSNGDAMLVVFFAALTADLFLAMVSGHFFLFEPVITLILDSAPYFTGPVNAQPKSVVGSLANPIFSVSICIVQAIWKVWWS